MSDKSYEEILHLPHPVSKTHAQMPVGDRAAQFAPFAALTGHNAAIKETARLTEKRIEPDDAVKTVLDEKLRYLQDKAADAPVAVFTHFVPDENKAGGAYRSESARLKRIDTDHKTITLDTGTVILIENLYRIDAEMFDADDWFC